jgi:hypothetical protein
MHIYILEAVIDYPENNIWDTDKYFEAVEEKLRNGITLRAIDNYINLLSDSVQEQNIMLIESLINLAEAYKLMGIYNISLEDLKSKINSLE